MRGSNAEQKRLTRESLLMALIDLWEQKPYDTITVTELARRAGVSRMAFYRNYESTDEIVAEHVRRLYATYLAELAGEGRTRFVDYSTRFFAYIAENEHFIRKALGAGFEWALLESIEDYMGSAVVLKVVDMGHVEVRGPASAPIRGGWVSPRA